MAYLKLSAFLAIATGFLIATAIDGSAQQSNQAKLAESQPSEQPTGLTWTKLCREIAVADPAKGEANKGEGKTNVNFCQVFRERLSPGTGSRLLAVSAVLRSDTKDKALSVTVPLGVDLRAGLQATIDGGEPIPISFARCTAGGCIATVELTSEWLKSLKAGQQLVLKGKGPRGKEASLEVPLSGFSAAYDGGPGDAKAYQERRAKLVQGIRAGRAGRVNKALRALKSQEQGRPQAQPQQQAQPQPPLGGPPLEIEIQR
jgi:invasion protein IalB